MINYKIIKLLGTGSFGSVYKVQINNKYFALKIQHIKKSDQVKNYKSKIWREIEFSNFTKKYPDQFMKLYNYEFSTNCDLIKAYTKSNFCIKFIYDLKDGTLSSIANKLTLKQIYSCIIQLTYCIYLLRKAGYNQSDLDPRNIAYKKTNKKYIKIFNLEIPTFGYIYSIIDYGEIYHKKYGFYKKDSNIDLIAIIHAFFREPIWKELKSKIKTNKELQNFNIISEKIVIKKIKNEPEYDLIKKYDKNLITLFYYVLNLKKYYEFLGITKIIKNVDKYIVKQKLDLEDYLFVLKNIREYKKVIKYFYDKL